VADIAFVFLQTLSKRKKVTNVLLDWSTDKLFSQFFRNNPLRWIIRNVSDISDRICTANQSVVHQRILSVHFDDIRPRHVSAKYCTTVQIVTLLRIKF